MKSVKRKKNKEEINIFGQAQIKWFVLATIFFIIILGTLGAGLGLGLAYEQKIFPGIQIASVDFSGLTKQQALEKIQAVENQLEQEGVKFKAEDKEVTINSIAISSSPDLAQPLMMIDSEQTVEILYAIGRNGSLPTNIFNRLNSFVFGSSVNLVYQIDQEKLVDHLKASFSSMEKLPIDAGLVINNGKAEVTGEQSGYVFVYEAAALELENNLKNFELDQVITLELSFAEPEIKKQYIGSALNTLTSVLELGDIVLNDGEDSWTIPQDQIIDWLEFQKTEGQIIIGLNPEKAKEFLETIANEINVPAKDAKLQFAGERIVEFQASQDGRTLNIQSAYDKLNNQIIIAEAAEITLPVEVAQSQVATDDLNDLGIKELLGRGTSNFSGSPVNRRHNIDVGVETLNGILIKPGEDFSLVDALGEIDGTTGYLQELVIKGDRTIPEYGGGLCQIGSTTFRAALWAGLPITERRNHSFRVRYYEPAGMDATIYDPAPDMRFLNDTGHHILFIAKNSGDDLIFEFYGTDDGRKVTIEPNPPRVYNVVQPGEPRYIETEDLKPGEKRKVESAYAGADTYFKYTVEYPNGEVKEQEFHSRYIPWRETWLVGKDPATATSTDSIVDVSEQPVVQGTEN